MCSAAEWGYMTGNYRGHVLLCVLRTRVLDGMWATLRECGAHFSYHPGYSLLHVVFVKRWGHGTAVTWNEWMEGSDSR
jgi:hypothetical protein